MVTNIYGMTESECRDYIRHFTYGTTDVRVKMIFDRLNYKKDFITVDTPKKFGTVSIDGIAGVFEVMRSRRSHTGLKHRTQEVSHAEVARIHAFKAALEKRRDGTRVSDKAVTDRLFWRVLCQYELCDLDGRYVILALAGYTDKVSKMSGLEVRSALEVLDEWMSECMVRP